MTIELNLSGTQEEMDYLFDNHNVRLFEKRGDKWYIMLRHNNNPFKRVRTIKGLLKKLGDSKK